MVGIFLDYFLEIRAKHDNDDFDEDSLEGYLTVKAAHIVIHANLDYKLDLKSKPMKFKKL